MSNFQDDKVIESIDATRVEIKVLQNAVMRLVYHVRFYENIVQHTDDAESSKALYEVNKARLSNIYSALDGYPMDDVKR